MAQLQNPWQSPLMRSYQQIKRGLVERIKTKLPEVTDVSEGNIFIILISMFAAIAEVVHYYIDGMARETFFSAAKRYSSLVKHARLVDYHIRSAIPSSADLLVTYATQGINDVEFSIPIGTQFGSDSGLTFVSTRNVTFFPGTYGAYVPVSQRVKVEPRGIGIITNQYSVIYLPSNPSEYYAEGTCILYIGDELWELVDTFGYSNHNSQVYKVELDDAQRPYIKFGDGVFGSLPPENGLITLGYEVTRGATGNVAAGSITSILSEIPIEGLVVTNPNAASGGSNYENFDMLKEHVPLSIRMLGVAISKQDYIDLARLAPGVDKSSVDYKCGKYVDVYITPDGGGIASSELTLNTYDFIYGRKIINTNLRILPTGPSYIYLDLTIMGTPSVRSTIIADNVQRALIDRYNYNSSDIGKVIRVSDIYSLVDNLPVVDYLTINKLYIKPYPKPYDFTTPELNIANFTNVYIDYAFDLVITMVSSSTYNLSVLDGETFTGEVGVDMFIAASGGYVSFNIQIGLPVVSTYKPGDSWTLSLIPINSDQVIGDFSIPIITLGTLTVNVVETT